jgi:hypothetical protein
MPASVERLLEAMSGDGLGYAGASFGPRGSGARVTALEPLFPKR